MSAAYDGLPAPVRLRVDYRLVEIKKTIPQFNLRADGVSRLINLMLGDEGGSIRPFVFDTMFRFYSHLPTGGEERLAAHLSRGLRLAQGRYDLSNLPSILQRSLVDTFLREQLSCWTRWWARLTGRDPLELYLLENKHLIFAMMVIRSDFVPSEVIEK